MFGKYLAWGGRSFTRSCRTIRHKIRRKARRRRENVAAAQGEGTAPRLLLYCRQEKCPAATQEKSGIATKGTERDGFSEACPLRERHARAPSPLREPEYGRAVPAGLRHLRREAFGQALIRSRCADLRHIPAEGRFFSDEAHERSQKKALETRYCDGTASRAGFSVFRCVCRIRRMSRMRLSCADVQSGGRNTRPGSWFAVWNSADAGEAA